MTDPSLANFDSQQIDGLEFCARAYALFEEIRALPDGSSRLRMRASEVEKRLLEEILPIAKYVQMKYRTGRYLSVRWINGNQQFDAVIAQSGSYIDQGYYPSSAFLEVTCVMHSKDYLSRELLNTKGFAYGLDGIRRLKTGEIESEPTIYNNQEFVDSFANILIEQIKKKIAIPYPANTTLIMQCSLNNLYTPDEWSKLEANVKANKTEHSFDEIFVYDTTSEYVFSLFGKQKLDESDT